MLDQSARHDRDRRLARLLSMAERTDGIIRITDATSHGFSEAALRRLVDTGLFERVAPGHLRSTATPWSLAARNRQAVLRSGPQAALGGTSALTTWGLLEHRPPIVVVVPRGVRGGGGEHRTVQCTDLMPIDVEQRGGLSVQTPTRAVVDAARDLSLEELHRSISEGVRAGLLSDERLLMRFRELARRGRPGVAKLRRVLAVRRPDEPEANDFERRLERIVESAALPKPIRQFRVRHRNRTYFLDFAWPEHRVWCECDSMLAHGSSEALHSDLQRQNDIIVATGFQPVRFTWRHLVDQTTLVAHTLTDMLRPRA